MKHLFIALAALLLVSASAEAQTMKKQADGTYVVNTSEICSAKGYRGKTPLKVYIKKGKITKTEMVSSKDNPQYYHKAKRGIDKQVVGKKATKVVTMKVDAVTGATYSSKALAANVKAAAAYYKKNR